MQKAILKRSFEPDRKASSSGIILQHPAEIVNIVMGNKVRVTGTNLRGGTILRFDAGYKHALIDWPDGGHGWWSVDDLKID